MLKPLNHHRRDSTLFQFTSRRLRDFIDPDHLPIRIDEQFDFAKLVTPLEDCYHPENDRPTHSGLARDRSSCECYSSPRSPREDPARSAGAQNPADGVDEAAVILGRGPTLPSPPVRRASTALKHHRSYHGDGALLS